MGFVLFSSKDTSINNFPLFLHNANVLCATFQRELPSNDPLQAISKQFGACPATTHHYQRPSWHLNGSPIQYPAALVFVANIQSLLRCGFQVLYVEFLEQTHNTNIDEVDNEHNFRALFGQNLQERRR